MREFRLEIAPGRLLAQFPPLSAYSPAPARMMASISALTKNRASDRRRTISVFTDGSVPACLANTSSPSRPENFKANQACQ